MLSQLTKPLTKASLYGKDVLLSPAANDLIAVVPTDGGEQPKIIPFGRLNLAFTRGHLTFPFEVPPELPVAANQSDEQRLKQDMLLQYVHRMNQQEHTGSRRIAKRVINEVKRELGDTHPPSASTLLRAVKKLNEYGNLQPLPRKQPQRFHDAAYTLFTEVIDDMFLCLGGASATQCWNEYQERAKQFEGKIKCFSRSTFYEHVNKLNRIEVLAAREGKKVSRNDSRIVYRSLITSRILERVEMDAVHINIGLINEQDEIITQVILYAMIDCYSRSILGYHLQEKKKFGQKRQQGENKIGILQNLIHSLSPKPNMSFVGNQYHWNMYGSAENFITDAGGPYASHEIGGFISAAGGDQHIAEAGAGYRKPYIERFFGTLRTQFLSILPGYMGKLKDAKQYDHPIQKHACLTVKQFESLLANYIVTGYHQNSHKGLLGKSPQQVWDETLDSSTTQLRVHDIGRLVRQNITPEKRTIQEHQGVQFGNTFYNSKALKNLYDVLTPKGAKNPEVECIFTELEPDQAWVKNPLTGELILAKVKITSLNAEQFKDTSEDCLLGADQPFSFNHPLVAQARATLDSNLEALDANKVVRPLNTAEITSQRDIFKAHSQTDTAPSFDKKSNESDALSSYSSASSYDDEDEFDGADLDD